MQRAGSRSTEDEEEARYSLTSLSKNLQVYLVAAMPCAETMKAAIQEHIGKRLGVGVGVSVKERMNGGNK